MNYISFNREERNLCTHLFRLLHLENDNYHILRKFLAPTEFTRFDIFTEVALIRDYYFTDKKNIMFLDEMIKIICKQEGIQKCRLYSELKCELNDPQITHPRQIAQKVRCDHPGYFNSDELKIYGCLQAYFNAKPDLAIILENNIIVYEAKLTSNQDKEQIKRTERIVEVWRDLLYKELGFSSPPNIEVKALGLAKDNPDISWENVRDIASEILDENDKSLHTLNCVLTR